MNIFGLGLISLLTASLVYMQWTDTLTLSFPYASNNVGIWALHSTGIHFHFYTYYYILTYVCVHDWMYILMSIMDLSDIIQRSFTSVRFFFYFFPNNSLSLRKKSAQLVWPPYSYFNLNTRCQKFCFPCGIKLKSNNQQNIF